MERLIDIEDEHLRLLRGLLNDHLANKAVWAYGSRVQWKANQSSDLDLVVWGASDSQVVNAKDAFSESNLPFTVQLLVWESIPQDFQKNIRKQYVVLQKGSKIPEGWREVKLGDVAEIKIGRTPPRKQHWWFSKNAEDKKWISVKDMGNSNLMIRDVSEYLTQEAIEKFNIPKIKKGTVILSFKLTVGRVAITNEDMYSNEAIAQFQIRKDVELLNYFLYYYLKYFNYSQLSSTSSIASAINTGIIKLIPINIPPLPEQKAIAEVLSSLDNKIDFLHRQNKTLEDIAQTLFRKWFIEDADENWEEKPLSEIYYFGKGVEPGSKYYEEKKTKNNIRFIRVGDMLDEKGVVFVDSSLFKENCKEADLLVSFDGTVARVAFGQKGIYSSGIRKIFSPNPIYDSFGLKYLLFKNKEIQNTIREHATGTVILHASSSIDFLSFALPKEEVIKEYNILVEPLFNKIFANRFQISQLEKLRDTLLPKLVSGVERVTI